MQKKLEIKIHKRKRNVYQRYARYLRRYNLVPYVVNKYRLILPKLLEKITRVPRYFPDMHTPIKWARNSWTHNTFRVYELIFGRRFGIKAEMSMSTDGKHTTYQAHSIEAMFALTEQYIRSIFSFRFQPVKIWIPMLSNPLGLPIPASPYLFAIAYDTSGISANNTSKTTSFTATGSNLMMFAWVADGYQGTMAYNGASMTVHGSWMNGRNAALFYKVAPDTGTHNVVLTSSNPGTFRYIVATYSGANQSGTLDSSATWEGTANGHTLNTTVVASNCWILGMVADYCTSTETISTGRTDRQQGQAQTNDTTILFSDSNGTVATGAQGFTFTGTAHATGSNSSQKVVSVAPAVLAPTVTTQAVSSIASTTATGNGNVTDDSGSAITERGVCWNTSTAPTTANSKATASGTTGAYTASMTGLSADTLYYVRAYAINAIGTSYGSEVTFTTISKISGQVTLSGSGVSGAVVRLIRQDTDAEVAKTTTDGSGNYSFTGALILQSKRYHICVEYTDGGAVKYNAKSLWEIQPVNI